MPYQITDKTSSKQPVVQPLIQTKGDKILLTLWIGALWTVGFLVVPTLFGNLEDRQIAGMLAGKLFTAVSYIGLFCGLILSLSEFRRDKMIKTNKRLWLLSLMMLVIIVGEFLIQPQMAELKQSGLSIGAEFDRLHGIATVLYMLNCLFGLILLIYNPPD